ncbi:MAG: hypothetical protein KKB46_03230, partial [Candidatus Omnitrophica bacterium]|nr:hypothetical protein [Candidatus Omnitrophota bacterium]
IGATDLDTVIVSNIGTWPKIYGDAVTNADSMKLIPRIPNVKVYIGGGYSLGSKNDDLRREKDIIFYRDLDRMIEYDFSVTMDSIARFEAYLQELYFPNVAFIGIFEGQRDFDTQVRELFEGQKMLQTAN